MWYSRTLGSASKLFQQPLEHDLCFWCCSVCYKLQSFDLLTFFTSKKFFRKHVVLNLYLAVIQTLSVSCRIQKSLIIQTRGSFNWIRFWCFWTGLNAPSLDLSLSEELQTLSEPLSKVAAQCLRHVFRISVAICHSRCSLERRLQ